GNALENGIADGIPRDELFVYEEALRRGRSVVVASTDDAEIAGSARVALDRAGAESVDAARDAWWIGLRDAEAEHYQALGYTSQHAQDASPHRFALAPPRD